MRYCTKSLGQTPEELRRGALVDPFAQDDLIVDPFACRSSTDCGKGWVCVSAGRRGSGTCMPEFKPQPVIVRRPQVPGVSYTPWAPNMTKYGRAGQAYSANVAMAGLGHLWAPRRW